MIGFFLQCYVTVFSFFVDESPRWLVKKGRYFEALKVFQKIAKWNGKQDEPIRLEDIIADENLTLWKMKIIQLPSHIT